MARRIFRLRLIYFREATGRISAIIYRRRQADAACVTENRSTEVPFDQLCDI